MRARQPANVAPLAVGGGIPSEFLTRLRSGDPDAFGEIYARYTPAMRRYLRVALQDGHDAEDVTHQVFVKARQGLAGYRDLGPDSFERWLFRIARNHVVDERRKRGRITSVEPAEIDRLREQADAPPPVEFGEWLTSPLLQELVDALPPFQARVIALRYVFGCSHRETAEILGTSEASTRQSHHKALLFIRRGLGRGNAGDRAGVTRTGAGARKCPGSSAAPASACGQSPARRNR